MSQGDKAGIDDPLLQVCTEKDLTRIARQVEEWESFYVYLNVTGPERNAVKENYRGNYEQQKVEILKLWKHKKGLQATFKVLADVFSKELNDQAMVGTINRLAAVAFEEPSEDLVIEHFRDFEQLGIDKLQTAISSAHMITDAYSETLDSAANDRKKLEVIVAALSHMVKQQLIIFLKDLKSEMMPRAEEEQGSKLLPMKTAEAKGDGGSVAVSSSEDSVDILKRTQLSCADKKFRLTVKNIKMHLMQCDVQDLITEFNISANDIPYFSNDVKEKLLKCESIKDLFLRLSPYISWSKRDVLRTLVEVSDCKDAVKELNDFELWLDPSQPIEHYPIPLASSNICPDLTSDITMVAIKANKDLKAVTYEEVEQYRDTIAQIGGISNKALDIQGKNPGSSVLYWLIPKSIVKSFEEKIRSNLYYLYEQGIVEILLDPNIVITTGRALRVRSLSYLTKLPQHDQISPRRAEELQDHATPDTELQERADEILELAYQLKTDIRKREKEIMELDNEVKNMDIMVKSLEMDKEEKNQECNQLKEQLAETIQENKELKKIVEEHSILAVWGLDEDCMQDMKMTEKYIGELLPKNLLEGTKFGPLYLNAKLIFIDCPSMYVAVQICYELDHTSVKIYHYILPNIYLSQESLLVLVDRQSGIGLDLLTKFRQHLNPFQVFDLTYGGPHIGLHTFRNFPQFRILICGGDSTCSHVLSALEEAENALTFKKPPCAILPLGTGNNLARMLAWGAGYGGEKIPSILQSVDNAILINLDRWKVVFKPKIVPTLAVLQKNPYMAQMYGYSSSDLASLDTDLVQEKEKIVGMSLYFGIGLDADISLDFNLVKQKNPDEFSSRFHNKKVYFQLGLQKMVTKKVTAELSKNVSIAVDNLPLKLPDLEGIVILNIQSWGAGAEIWGNPSDQGLKCGEFNDGLFEVVGIGSVMHMGQMQGGLRGGIRLAQGSKCVIIIHQAVSVQVDGEPWLQRPCTITLEKCEKQAAMLQKVGKTTSMAKQNSANALQLVEPPTINSENLSPSPPDIL